MPQLIICQFLVFLCFSLSTRFASAASIQQTMQQNLEQGKSYENKLQLGNPDSDGNKSFLNKDANVSNFANLTDQDLTSKGANELNNSEVGTLLQQSEIGKLGAVSEHQINSDNSMLKNSSKIESDPLKETGGDNYVVSESASKVTINKSCLDGVDFEVEVLRQLIVENELVAGWGVWQDRIMPISQNDLNASLSKLVVEEGSHGPGSWFRHEHLLVREEDPLVQRELKNIIISRLGVKNDHVGDYVTVGYEKVKVLIFMFLEVSRLHYKFRDSIEQFKEKGEYWQVVNEAQEALVESHDCHVTKRQCLETGNKVFFEKFTVNRPCWKEQITYACSSEPINGCKHLTDQGCTLSNSRCNEQVAIQGSGNGNICLQWLRNYQCYSEKKELRSSLKNAPIFCLGGDCHTATIMQNDDIHLVGYLAMLNEIRKDMQADPIRVFKGEFNSCDKCAASFINCCSSMKGWGKDLSLSRCTGQEKALALKKSKGLCHYVGTYCSNKDPIFGKCLTKKSTYCCFNSKLSRIFQEQGRKQLGISFGSNQTPDCRGFTTEELQRIDFSKFDLEELFADLIASSKSKMLKAFPSQTAGQMPVIQKQVPVNSKNHDPNLSY